MKNLLLTLLLFAAALASPAQQTTPVTTLATLNDLLAKVPRSGETIAVRTGYNGQDWGGERVFTHFPTNIASLTTNVAHVFNVVTNAYNVAGQWRSADRTNSVQDARWWRVPIDGTSDSRPALQAAMDWARTQGSGRGAVKAPPFTYKIYGSLTNNGIRLSAPGATLVGDGTNYTWIATGSIGSYQNLDTTANISTNIIYCAALASNVVSGDLLKVISSADFSSGGDANRSQGEMVMVNRVSGSAIYLEESLADTYTTANTGRVAKVTPTWYAFDPNLSVIPPPYNATNAPTPRGGFSQYTKGVSITSSLYAADESCLIMLDDYGSVVSDVAGYRGYYAGGGNSYGIFVGNASRNTIIQNCTMQGARNPFDLGGNSDGGVVWNVRFSNCTGSQSDLTTQDAFGSHASVGSVIYDNCTAIGTALSQRGFSGHGRNVTVQNCKTTGLAYGVYAASYTDTRDSLVVDGLTMSDPIGTGYGVAVANVTLGNLTVKNTSGEVGQYAVLVTTGSTIGNWTFSNLDNDIGGGILIGSGVTVPQNIYVPNSVWRSSAPSVAFGVLTSDGDVVRVSGNGIRSSNLAGLVSISALATLPQIDCVGCASTDTSGSPFLFNGSARSVRVVGGSFRTRGSNGALVSVTNIAESTFIGNETDSTITSWISGTATNVTRIGNDTAVTVANAGTLAGSYWMALPSSGAVPFSLTIDTTAADNFTSIRAIASGKSRLYIGGRSSGTIPSAYGMGGGDITLQNLNKTPGTFNQITTLDGVHGDQGGSINFIQEDHTNHLASISFLTRGGGNLIDAGGWKTNGVLQAKVGLSAKAATNIVTYGGGWATSPVSGATDFVSYAISTIGRELVNATDAAAARSILGITTATNLDNLTVTNAVRFGGNFTISDTIGGTDRFTLTGSGINSFLQFSSFGDFLVGSAAGIYASSTNNWFYNGLNQYWPSTSDRVWLTSLGFKSATPLRGANILDSTTIDWTTSGTNITPSIKSQSLSTNLIDSTFYNFITSQATGGSATTNRLVKSLYQNGSSLTIADTHLSEITIMTNTPSWCVTNFAAGYWTSDKSLHVEASGTFSAAGDWSGNVIRVKLGGYVLSYTFDEPDSTTPTDAAWRIVADIQVATPGASATVAGVGSLIYYQGTPATMLQSGVIAAVPSGTLDTTVQNTLSVTYDNDGTQPLTFKVHSLFAEEKGAAVTTSGGGSSAPASYVAVNGTTNNWNFNSTTPAATSPAVLARVQSSGTNATFVVDVAPTYGGLTSPVMVSNTLAYTTIASGTLNTTNLPYDGASLSGRYFGTLYNNTLATQLYGIRLLISGTVVLNVYTPSMGSSTTHRAWITDLSISRLSTNLQFASIVTSISGAVNPLTGYGDPQTAPGETARPSVSIASTANLTTNATWSLEYYLSTSSTNFVVTATGGGLK